MKALAGMLLMPFMLNNSQCRRKIDGRLLKKTRTLGNNSISAIVFSKEDHGDSLKEYLKSKDIKIKYELPLIGAYAIEIHGGKLEDMAKVEVVRYISDDVRMSSLLDVAAQEVGARVANETGYTGKGVGIAILDTGVYPHQDFIKPRNRIVAFKDFINNKQSPYDDNGHGTFTTGVAAGNGYASGGKYKGIAPEANIISIKVMDGNGAGNSSDIIAGMQWVADHHKEYNIRVMSLSLGAEPSTNRFDPLAAAVEGIWKKGIVVVAAAGNEGPKQNTITTPGISPTIITVGAVDDKRTVDAKDDVIAEFSSRGAARGKQIKPDIVAPGVDITATNANKEYKGISRQDILNEPYTKMSGTSVATPVVSGAAALMIGKNPEITPIQVKQSMMNNAVRMNISKYVQGSGILSIRAMMDI